MSSSPRCLFLFFVIGCSSSTSTRFVGLDGGGATGEAEAGAAGAAADGGVGGYAWGGSGGGAGTAGTGGTSTGGTGGTGGAAGAAGAGAGGTAGTGTAGAGGGATCATPLNSVAWPVETLCINPGSPVVRKFQIQSGTCTLAWQPATVAGSSAFFSYSASCSAAVVTDPGCNGTGCCPCTLTAVGDGTVSVSATSVSGGTSWTFGGCPTFYPQSAEDAGKVIGPELDQKIRDDAKAACIFP